MSRSVLLEHALPDGTVHWDWLIQEPGAPQDERVPTFRLEQPLGEPAYGERIGDHRAMYLDYEGPISQDRGVVRRVWQASVVALDLLPEHLHARLTDAQGDLVVQGRLEDDGRWLIRSHRISR